MSDFGGTLRMIFEAHTFFQYVGTKPWQEWQIIQEHL